MLLGTLFVLFLLIILPTIVIFKEVFTRRAMKRASKYDHAVVNCLTVAGRQLSTLLNHLKLIIQELTISSYNFLFNNRVSRFILVIILITIASFVTWHVYLNITSKNYLGSYETKSELGEYSKYAVSTDAKHCAKVGARLLANGGSAVDASIGTLLCMGVVLPNSMGLGGGCLMTIYNTTSGQAWTINGRETAPHYASEDMFANNASAAARGPLSIGIPGELAAYARAHKLYGKLPWRDLFVDPIEMAEFGAPMVDHLASALRDPRHAQYMSPELRQIFTNKTTGMLLNTGDIVIMKQLAETLKRIRDNGPEEFYTGTTAQNFIADLEKQGGKMTLQDLGDYTVVEGEPLKFSLTPDLNLYTQPLPGSGIILSIILRVMRNLGYYGQRDVGAHFLKSSQYYHHLVESFKFAYNQRAALEDQPDDPVRLEKLMAVLKSEVFTNSIAHKIDKKTHEASFYEGLLQQFAGDGGTAHVSVLDSSGLAVATTTSINLYFGSGLVSNSTGIIYNDIMDDFVSPNVTNKFGIPPSDFNRIRPGRRPISSMAPSVFVDKKTKRVRLIIGSSGGTQITTGIATVSLRHLYLGEDIKTAIDGRRLHHQFLPNLIVYEEDFPAEILDSLRQRNHSTKLLTSRSSIVMAIANRLDETGNDYITANSDARKGGAVEGL